jgi:hypothetical protein
MNRFVGTWKLVSVEDRSAAGEVEYPYGEDPVGVLVYDSTGRMAVQIMRSDRPHLSSDNLRDAHAEEIRAAADGFTAFFGSYIVDEAHGRVIHTVEGHLTPNSVGKNLVRAYEFVEDRLILRPGRSRTIVWKRAT